MSEPQSLVPPRPNLGPEPWPETSPFQMVWMVVAGAALLVVAWFLWRIVRRRLARSLEKPAAADALDDTPRGRLVALSGSAKSALAARFGSTWRAKTTEELAVEPALAELLGPEMFRELIEFLDRTDRLKFAPERPARSGLTLEEELAAWDPRIASLIGRIGAKTNGRHEKQATRAADAAASPSR